MKYLKLFLIFTAVFLTLFCAIALPAMAAGQDPTWYTFCVLGSASALITAIFSVPAGTKS